MEPSTTATSQSVLSRLSSLVYGGGPGAEVEVEDKKYWMRDDTSLECYECTSKFTQFRRRHHCRVCGHVFCSRCCSLYIPGKQNSSSMRACVRCFQTYQSMLDQMPQERVGSVGRYHQGPEFGQVEAGGHSPSQARMSRRPSIDQVATITGDQVPASAGGPSLQRKISKVVHPDHVVEEGQDVKMTQEITELKDPETLRRLWSRVVDPEVGVRRDTHRSYFTKYPDTFQGRTLVEWLAHHDISISHGQGLVIGQAFLTAGLMTPVSGRGQFSGATELYRPAASIETETDLHLQDEPDSEAPGDIQGPAWVKDLPVLGTHDLEDEVRMRDSADEVVEPEKYNKFLELRDSVKSREVGLVSQQTIKESILDKIYMKHETNYLTSLLKIENISSEWMETIHDLAEIAVNTVKPEVRYKDDELDILTYVKVKCVTGAARTDCRLVEGDVCSLQFTHRNMATKIYRPRIALIQESIMFKDRNTIVSLDTVSMQEAEYIRNVVGKLLDLKPNIVLVEKSVAKLAQEIFLTEGVSLAVNVKPKVLSRLSRLTQGSIISSVDTMITAPNLGTCGEVSSETASNRKRLMFFEKCRPSLGGTILLRGGDLKLLSKVKAVLKRIILLKYNWLHERSLFSNEYASISENFDTEMSKGKNHFSISPFVNVQTNNAVEDSDVPFAVEVTEEGFSEGSPDPVDEGVCDKIERHPWCDRILSGHITNISDLEDTKALFRAAGWRRKHATRSELRVREKVVVRLPEDQTQTLPVQWSMFSSQSRVAPSYCIAPRVLSMRLYSEYDMGLGEFLETLCFSADYVCPNKDCSTPPILHKRRFCFSGSAVMMEMQQLEGPLMGEEEGSETLVMWKYCARCKLSTSPIVPVSDLTWSLSFAMFLQLLFSERQMVVRGAEAVCPHSLHQEQLTCFGRGDQVVTFEFSKLQVLDIETPENILAISPPSYTREKLTKALKECKEASSSTYSSILTSLHSMRDKVLETDQENEHRAYRERLDRLEETVNSDVQDASADTMALLTLFKRDIVLSHLSWTRRLGMLMESSKYKHVSSTSIDGESRVRNESDTVKKIISTILPQSLSSIPFPFNPEMHLITHVNGAELDPPRPQFVYENKPSSLISYMLSSASYRAFLAKPGSETQHFDLEMSDANTKFYCCSYFTAEFHALRSRVIGDCSDDLFMASLADCDRWEAMGGKSGLFFYKTTDDRFVLKQMSRFEYQAFLDFAPHYFEYLKKSSQNEGKSLLGKILGVYKVGFKNSLSNSGMSMEFLIMENLFYNKKISRSYDLKGSVRNRLILEDGGQQGAVLLDENLLRVSCERPLYVNETDKNSLNQAIKRDATFLASHRMMDYSLLVGICDENSVLVVGIIDYIRTFTWDKKLETLVKSMPRFGGQAKTPTVINPDLYKIRFIEAMNRYFAVVQ